jgi:glutathione S-transferase
VALIRCYRVPFSTNVERVALAAGHKGVAIDWVDVDPADRSPVEAVSGQPSVPALVAGGEVVTGSPRILAWLEERFPEPPLYPHEASRRAEVAVPQVRLVRAAGGGRRALPPGPRRPPAAPRGLAAACLGAPRGRASS